jgi:hypothetical protein
MAKEPKKGSHEDKKGTLSVQLRINRGFIEAVDKLLNDKASYGLKPQSRHSYFLEAISEKFEEDKRKQEEKNK